MKRPPIRLTSSFSGPTSPFLGSSYRYVCVQCRQSASLRIPAVSPAVSSTLSHRRSYATEPNLPDKFQSYFNEKIGKRLFKDGQIPNTGADGVKQPGNEPAIPPKDTEPATGPLDDDPYYVPAMSAEELEMVGGPSGWWEKAWDEEHQFQGWMRPTPMQDGTEIRRAIERALVEWCTVEKGSIKFRESVGAARRLWANDRSWESPPVGKFKLWQRRNGKLELEWERPEDQMEMQRWLQEPFQQNTETVQLEDDAASVLEPEDLETAASTPTVEDDRSDVTVEPERVTSVELEDPADASLQEDGGIQATPRKHRIHYTGLQGDISLQNHNLKFTIIKRVMQLTGIRIPDTAIQSIGTSAALWDHLIQKPKPKKLAQLLIEGYVPAGKEHEGKYAGAPLLINLPNVKILPTKYVPSMTETALGRQKVIEQQLDEHDIPVPFKEEMEQITAYEEQRLRRHIDAMTEDDGTEVRDRMIQEPLPDDGNEVPELQRSIKWVPMEDVTSRYQQPLPYPKQDAQKAIMIKRTETNPLQWICGSSPSPSRQTNTQTGAPESGKADAAPSAEHAKEKSEEAKSEGGVLSSNPEGPLEGAAHEKVSKEGRGNV
ncbi:MAG: hypothetical protein Q9171_004386 [Xanthocarpia ochracea]